MDLQDPKQKLAAGLVIIGVLLLLLLITRKSTQMPAAVDTAHYNSAAILMKDGSGCVNAAEQKVPCPPGTIVANAAPATSGTPSISLKIPGAGGGSGATKP